MICGEAEDLWKDSCTSAFRERQMVTQHDTPFFFELPLDAVDVWCVFTDRVTDPQVLERYDKVLAAEERVRRDRFVFAKDRHQFLVTRGVLRTLLSRYARMRPEECVFVTNAYGKPSLDCRGAAQAAFEFNVSHTNGLAAIAVTIGREIGIDVEEVTRASVDPRRAPVLLGS